MVKDIFAHLVTMSEMEPIYREKLDFCRERLSPMVSAMTNGVIVSCDYEKSAVAPVERVAISYVSGVSNPVEGRLGIDVTGDSKYAIVKDVMRGVERIYG